MTRLPTIGSDNGIWCKMLIEFLSVEHNDDGTLKSTGTLVGKADNAAVVHKTGDETVAGVKTFSSSPIVPAPTQSSQAATKAYVDTAAASGTADATTTSKGKIQLAGDLAGTADAPTVPNAIKKGDLLLNVKDYGAKGDGTTDDTTAINSAITAAPANGAIIYFPPGSYVINSAIILKDKITLLGSGQQSSQIKQNSTTAHGLSATSASGVRYARIQGLRITGPGPATGTGDGIHHDRNGSWGMWNWEITDVYIENFGGYGVLADCPILTKWTNVTARYCGLDGFRVIGSGGANGTSLPATACYAAHCNQAGYYVESQSYSSFVSCAADACGMGYWLKTSRAISMSGCGTESNQAIDATYTGTGFRIDGCSAITLNSPDVVANAEIAYLVTGTSTRVVLVAPREAAPTGTPTAGIKVDTGSYAQIIATNTLTANVLNGNVYQIGQAGDMGWGAGSGIDTTLARTAAGVLSTTSLKASGQIRSDTDGNSIALYSTVTADGTNTSLPVMQIETASGNKRLAQFQVTGDTIPRIRLNSATALGAGGSITLTDGASGSANIYHHSSILKTDADFALNTAGKGLRVKEGANAKMGTATLVGGTTVVSNTSVTATSRIFLTVQTPAGTVGAPYVSARTAGTSFTITSTSGTDTSTVAYQIVEPA